MRRLSIILTSLLLVLIGLASLSPSANAVIAPQRCRVLDGGTSYQSEICITIKYRMSRKAKLIHASFVENDTRDPATGHCSSTETKTFRWGGSITVSAEAKAWIFAKVSGSVTASFDKTRSTAYSVSTDFTVRPGDTVYCYYIEVHERFMTRQCYANAYTQGRQCKDIAFFAPKREGWVISNDPLHY